MLMKYIGDDWDGSFVFNDSTRVIEFGVWHISNIVDDIYILVYTYGDQPHCYVGGCEIINWP